MNKKLPHMQNVVLNRLMFAETLSYSDIHEVTDNHDLFNYHLRELVTNGYLKKQSANYTLTKKGKQYVSHMEEDGTRQEQIKVGMFIDIVRKHNNKNQMLLHRRLKHPHYGYIGAVTGKLRWGDSLEENITRELQEEVQIDVKSYNIIGTVHELFRNKKHEVVGDGVFFVIVVDGWSGEIMKKSIEGEYFWHDIDKILELDKIFRQGFEQGLPHLTKFLTDKKNYIPYILENLGDSLSY